MVRKLRRGVYALEFALTVPIWFMLLLGVADLSWLFMHLAVLDFAATSGCRAGAIIDPGDFDTNIAAVTNEARDVMEAIMDGYGLVPMDNFFLDAFTDGAPPTRVLVCEAEWEVEPLIGLVWSTRRFRTREVARLEWQREAAP